MDDAVVELQGVPVLVCAEDGEPIASTQDALDVIGAAFSRADVVAVPVRRLDDQFFALRTGLAGEVMQKFTNYRLRLVVVGDISALVADSPALRDLVFESNRGRQVWFVADLDELDARLHPEAR
jgi:pyruvate/2-oxoacid:ferredoxin oxidoreductase alpha subunit